MIWAVVNSKGGVGKSTVAVNLAVWLARHDQQVRFIDTDSGQLGGKWIAEACPDIQVKSLLTPEDVLEQARHIEHGADVVVCDGSAGLPETSRALLLVSDLALLPACPSGLDLLGLQAAVRVFRQAIGIRGEALRGLVVLNRVSLGTVLARQLIDAVKGLEVPVARTILKARQVYAQASGLGITVWDMGAKAKAAQAELDSLFTEVYRYGQAKRTKRPYRKS